MLKPAVESIVPWKDHFGDGDIYGRLTLSGQNVLHWVSDLTLNIFSFAGAVGHDNLTFFGYDKTRVRTGTLFGGLLHS